MTKTATEWAREIRAYQTRDGEWTNDYEHTVEVIEQAMSAARAEGERGMREAAAVAAGKAMAAQLSVAVKVVEAIRAARTRRGGTP